MSASKVPVWQDAPTVRERHDPTRVLPYVDAYWARRAELDATGRYPYHSEFYDLPGIAECSRPESPVYVLSGLYDLVQRHDREAVMVEQGYRHVTAMDPGARVKTGQIIVFAYHFSGLGSYQVWEWQGARLCADENGRPAAVIPFGKRRGVAVPVQASVYMQD